MATKKDLITCAGEGQSLLKCTGNKTESDFYSTFNMWGKGHSRYCKKCLDKIYDYYYKNSNENDKVALYYTLIQENTPFITDIYDKLKPKIGKITPNKYFTELSKTNKNVDLWKDFSASDFKLIDSEAMTDPQIKEYEKKWGTQTLEGYKFLEETYDRYLDSFDEMSTAQEDLLRDLCIYRLILREINDGTYAGELSQEKVQGQIAKLLNTLKLDNFAEKKEYTISEQLMFNKIAQIELTKPADLYKEPKKYKDFNKVKKYYQDVCLRALKNTLAGDKNFDIKLDNLEEYDFEGKLESGGNE